MARKLRLEFPGACYHVINRGNYRTDVFQHNSTKAEPKGSAHVVCGPLSVKSGQPQAVRCVVGPFTACLIRWPRSVPK